VQGSRQFRTKMLESAKGEQTRRQAVQKRPALMDWSALQQRLSQLKGQPGSRPLRGHDDDGRARPCCGDALNELGSLVGVSYPAVAQAITKAEHRIAHSLPTVNSVISLALPSNLRRDPWQLAPNGIDPPAIGRAKASVR
jgi:DNA-binding transcriptional regulator YdaS (Cro superfamily)